MEDQNGELAVKCVDPMVGRIGVEHAYKEVKKEEKVITDRQLMIFLFFFFLLC
jgi:hypothetical protein